jgi:hypothetical protein
MKAAWTPSGDLSHNQQLALSVPAPSKPDRSLYRTLLVEKLSQMIASDPKEARRVLEMSSEGAPEFWSIAQNNPMMDWAAQLVASDQLMLSLNRIDWSAPGEMIAEPQMQLAETLEALA